MCPPTLALLLSVAVVLLGHISQTSGKCSGAWAIHACRGGNVKRSDAEIRQTQQTPPWMMQRVFGKNAEELAKSGRNNSRLTRLGFLLMRNGDVGGHDDVRDLLVRSWLKQKLLKRETSDPKEKTNAKEQLLRYWLKEKAVAKRGDDSDSIGDSDIDSDSDSGERRRLLVTMERRLTAEENGIGAVSNAGTWNTNAQPRHNPSALKLTGPAWT